MSATFSIPRTSRLTFNSLFLTWIFWVAGAAAITATLGGGLNCSYVRFSPMALRITKVR